MCIDSLSKFQTAYYYKFTDLLDRSFEVFYRVQMKYADPGAWRIGQAGSGAAGAPPNLDLASFICKMAMTLSSPRVPSANLMFGCPDPYQSKTLPAKVSHEGEESEVQMLEGIGPDCRERLV
jgi:hypothetical protein